MANSADESLARTAPVLGPYIGGVLTIIYTLRITVLIRSKVDFGLPLYETSCDELDYLILDVANDLDVSGPNCIFLLREPEAFAYDSGVSSGSKRVLCVGWPLVRVLTRTELKAVIAHELAHFDEHAFIMHHAIWRVANSLSKIRLMLSDEFKDMADLGIRLALSTYLKIFQSFFDNSTQRALHEFEFYCDNKGAQEYGSNVFADALTKVIKIQICYNDFVERFPSSSMNSSYDDFFNYYWSLLPTPELDEVIKQIENTDDASHPSLSSRIRAVEEIPAQLDVSSPIIRDPSRIHAIQNKVVSFYANTIRNRKK